MELKVNLLFKRMWWKFWESFFCPYWGCKSRAGENSFLPSEIICEKLLSVSEGRSVSGEDTELSKCEQGWTVSQSLCQSHRVLVASGLAVGTGRNVNLALSSSAGALLVKGSLLQAQRVYYQVEAMTRYRNICHGKAVNSGIFLFNKQYFTRTASVIPSFII